MNKKNLEILGLSEGATEAEITAAYNSLRAKYSEERFLDGEAGNNAAKMLTKIETAYNELLGELSEDAQSKDGGASFAKVEEFIRAGNIAEAQRTLDAFNERNAQWHYLQSVVFYRKNWINESKKQLEIAIQLDPSNDKYKETYRKLNDRMQSDAQSAQNATQSNGGYQSGYQGGAYQGQDMNYRDDGQMGGGACASCLDTCFTCMCLNILCNGCCR